MQANQKNKVIPFKRQKHSLLKQRAVPDLLLQNIDATEMEGLKQFQYEVENKSNAHPPKELNELRRYDSQIEWLLCRGVSNPYKIQSMLGGVLSIRTIQNCIQRVKALWAMNTNVNDMEQARVDMIVKIQEIYFSLWKLAEDATTKKGDKIYAFSVLADLIKKESELRGFDKQTINMLVNMNTQNNTFQMEGNTVLAAIADNKQAKDRVMEMLGAVNQRLHQITAMKDKENIVTIDQ